MLTDESSVGRVLNPFHHECFLLFILSIEKHSPEPDSGPFPPDEEKES